MSNEFDEFAELVKSFREFVERKVETASAAEGLGILLELCRVAVRLEEVEPDDFEVEIQGVAPESWRGFSRQHYFEVFDPLELSEPLEGDLDDDILDVYTDLVAGLRALEAGHRAAAQWHWRFSFYTHWGEHAVDAIRVLYRMARVEKGEWEADA